MNFVDTDTGEFISSDTVVSDMRGLLQQIRNNFFLVRHFGILNTTIHTTTFRHSIETIDLIISEVERAVKEAERDIIEKYKAKEPIIRKQEKIQYQISMRDLQKY